MKHILIAAGVLTLVCASAHAQEAEPGADLRKLDIWLGDWAYEIENLARHEEGVRVEGTATLGRWGKTYVLRSQSRGVSAISIWRYDQETKAYVVETFTNTGGRGAYVVQFGERTVTSETIGAAAVRTRCRKDLVAEPTEECETLRNGKWTPSSRIRWRRVSGEVLQQRILDDTVGTPASAESRASPHRAGNPSVCHSFRAEFPQVLHRTSTGQGRNEPAERAISRVAGPAVGPDADPKGESRWGHSVAPGPCR